MTTPTPHHFSNGSHPAEEPSGPISGGRYLARLNEKLSKRRSEMWYWRAAEAQAKAIMTPPAAHAKSRLRRRAVRLARWSLTFHRILALHRQDVMSADFVAEGTIA